jgi:hypothetical protein
MTGMVAVTMSMVNEKEQNTVTNTGSKSIRAVLGQCIKLLNLEKNQCLEDVVFAKRYSNCRAISGSNNRPSACIASIVV